MEIIIILALILLNGILSMTEMAFVTSRKYKQQADDRFLSTIQIGITLIAGYRKIIRSKWLSV